MTKKEDLKPGDKVLILRGTIQKPLIEGFHVRTIVHKQETKTNGGGMGFHTILKDADETLSITVQKFNDAGGFVGDGLDLDRCVWGSTDEEIFNKISDASIGSE